MYKFTLVALLAGCGYSTTWHVQRATPDEFEAIRAAADEWCAASSRGFCPEIVQCTRRWCPSHRIVITDAAGVRAIVPEATNPMGVCHRQWPDEDIFVARMPLDLLRITVVHELGHSDGAGRLQHVPGEGTAVMNSVLRTDGPPEHLTSADLAQYCAANGCRYADGSVSW